MPDYVLEGTIGASAGHNTNLAASMAAGKSVVSDATTAHTKGPYTELIASTGALSHGLWVGVADSASHTSSYSACLLDIAVGAAGAESVVAPNLCFGGARTTTAAPWLPGFTHVYLPGLSIPAGSRIAARLQSQNTSRTFYVWYSLDLTTRWNLTSSVYTTYGATTATSLGTTLTPATFNFFGDAPWVEVGTTSSDHNLWVITSDWGANTAISSSRYIIQLGYGAAVTSVNQFTKVHVGYGDGSNENNHQANWPEFTVTPIPSGTIIWARAIPSAGATSRSVCIHAI